MLTAAGLAKVMDDLFHGVIYAGNYHLFLLNILLFSSYIHFISYCYKYINYVIIVINFISCTHIHFKY